MRFAFLNIAFVIGCVALSAIGARVGLAAEQVDPLARRVEGVFKGQAIASIAIDLGARAGIAVHIEDVPMDQAESLATRRVDATFTDQSIKNALDRLATDSRAFSWRGEGSAVNVMASGLGTDNPLNQEVGAISFKGTRSQFRRLLNEKLPDLGAFEVSMHGPSWDPPVVIETTKPSSVRQLLNIYAAQAKVCWFACVKPPRPPQPSDQFRVASRTMLSFQKVPVADDPLEAAAPAREFKRIVLTAALVDLSIARGLSVCVEYRDGDPWFLAKTVSLAPADRTLRQFLDALKKETEAFDWHRDGGTINVVGASLKGVNPLDEKINPFDFKGNGGEFLALVNSKAPSLQAFEASMGKGGSRAEVVSFSAKEALTVREALNRYASAAGVCWLAQIRPAQPEVKEPVVSTDTAITGVAVSTRTMITFIEKPQ